MMFLLAGCVLVLGALIKVAAVAAFLFRLRLPDHGCEGRVALILPLSGHCPALPALLRALDLQTLRPSKLIVAVESTTDPAYGQAQQAVVQASFPVEICIAGETERCAQKCWNQIAALHRLDGQDEAVVLLDGDIDPPPCWLSLLVTPILAGKAEVVTGYRWHRPTRPTFAQHLVTVIDRGIALLPVPASTRLTWGGSLALSPKALAALDLPRLLARTLSDDCAIGSLAHRLGLRILTRRLLRVPCHPPTTFAAAWRFGRRQYQIIRLYRQGLWRLVLAMLTVRLCAWGVLFFSFASVAALVAILAVLLLLSLTVMVIQQTIARRLGLPDDGPTIRGQLALTLCEPLTTLIHWSVVAAAFRTRTLRWGHVVYRVEAGEVIRVTARTSWATGDDR